MLTPLNQAEASEAENKEAFMPSNTMLSTFAVLASIQEAITFLRRCDDVVVSTPEGKFLVNGRFWKIQLNSFAALTAFATDGVNCRSNYLFLLTRTSNR
jgi:hypothetical protein